MGAPHTADLLVGLVVERDVFLGKEETCVTSVSKISGKMRKWGLSGLFSRLFLKPDMVVSLLCGSWLSLPFLSPVSTG